MNSRGTPSMEFSSQGRALQSTLWWEEITLNTPTNTQEPSEPLIHVSEHQNHDFIWRPKWRNSMLSPSHICLMFDHYWTEVCHTWGLSGNRLFPIIGSEPVELVLETPSEAPEISLIFLFSRYKTTRYSDEKSLSRWNTYISLPKTHPILIW